MTPARSGGGPAVSTKFPNCTKGFGKLLGNQMNFEDYPLAAKGEVVSGGFPLCPVR